VQRRHLVALLALVLCAAPAAAQRLNPVKWKLAFEPSTALPGATVLGRLTATMEGEWHLYSMTTPKGGPNETTISLAENPAVQSWKIYQPKPERKLDPNFGIDTETFAREAVFLVEVQIAPNAPAGPVDLTANTRFQACTDRECLPPRRVAATATLTIDPAAEAAPPVIPAGYSEFKPAAAATPATGTTPLSVPSPSGGTAAPGGLGTFLALAFGFGLAAIFTPCVFPMIPITLSFFMGSGEKPRSAAIRQAFIFCLGIIVLFTGIGFAITAALGPFGAVLLGSNPWVNLFIAIVFFIFGLSLLGAFEITLPSGLLTRLDSASRGGGTAATLLMGLTFSLTSFACVGPFIGTLLAASVQGDKLQPLLGMAAFATGLASPFFLLALFPSWLARLPRSGGWMVRVKVVLGFVVLAAMLKYLSSVDQVLQWNILTRERFLAIWFVLFMLPGFYLLGLLRMEGIRPDEPVGTGRLLTGTAFLAFALSLLPGMFGSRLGELDAFVPLASDTTVASGEGERSGLAWMKNRYNEALAKAREENKLLLVSFTGYACTNCHWMKANMFPRPEVIAAMKDMVLVELYTDGTDPESEQNQRLQETRFGTVAIPFYAIMDAREQVIATFGGATRKSPEFVAFLEKGSTVRTAETR
jgi:thiol:disulfide interchange protein DsbD